MDAPEQRDEFGRRVTASFIPYRRTADGIAFYLQFRDGNARVHPSMFSTFGGALDEGEMPEECMLRETQEELAYTPQAARFFCTYVTQRALFHAYFEEVGDDFETLVEVREGQYGAFLTAQAVKERPDVSPIAKLMVEEFAADAAAM